MVKTVKNVLYLMLRAKYDCCMHYIRSNGEKCYTILNTKYKVTICVFYFTSKHSIYWFNGRTQFICDARHSCYGHFKQFEIASKLGLLMMLD